MKLCLLSWTVALCAVAPVRADDWLAVLPGCSVRAVSLPALELIYPGPGLPAVVAAGDAIVARVRVPAALTPPPGVQQDRALAGWSAELIGAGIVVGSSRLTHRYSLPVVDLRPDTGSSLLYRLRIAVPAYLAPGSYGLRLRTPFGDREAQRSVAVLVAGVAPRLAALPEAPADALATAPVDVWIAPSAPAEQSAPSEELQPTLTLQGRALALRVGTELWVSAACQFERAGFEADVANLLRSERRSSQRLVQPPPMAASAPISWQRNEHGLAIDNTAGSSERWLRVLIPARSSSEASGAQLELYPASDLDARRLAAISLRLRVPAGARASLEIGAPAPAEEPWFEPALAESGVPTRVHVRGAAPDARVAFEYGFARSAFTGPVLPVSFAGPLEKPLRALVLTPRGGAQWVRGELRVSARRPPTCSAGGEPVGGMASFRGGLLFYLAILLKRRPRWRIGNRLGPALRWFGWWSWKKSCAVWLVRSRSRLWPRVSPR